MSRGKIPRSIDLNSDNDFYYYSYLFDAALATIATSKLRPNLATEIVNGEILAQLVNGNILALADSRDVTELPIASPVSYNNVNAITAYALGYYLEQSPLGSNYCLIVDPIRKLLNYLEGQRDFVLFDGLIIKADATVSTEDNLLAYFAFKQAGSILGEPNYTNTANQLKDSIISRLQVPDSTNTNHGKLYNGIDNINVPFPSFGGVEPVTQLISVNAYGALFFLDINDIPSAQILLNNCERFKTTDTDNGSIGYKSINGIGNNKVWFEASYAVALGYYRSGNKAKYTSIINELNKFIDLSDGGEIGSLIKDDTLAETFIDYKGIGSTAWALITNKLHSIAFKIRTISNPITGCAPIFFNEVQSDDFTKEDCGAGTTPSTVTYTVAAGRYISYVSQVAANNLAIADITANGQAYANAHGECIGNFGNEQQSQDFTRNNCGAGFTGSLETYIVPADTFFAPTLSDANDLALADITANGQTYANSTGTCTSSSTDSTTGTTFVTVGTPTMSGVIVVNTIGGRTLRVMLFSTCGNAGVSVTLDNGIGTITNFISNGLSNQSQYIDTFLPQGTYNFSGSLTASCTSGGSLGLL